MSRSWPGVLESGRGGRVQGWERKKGLPGEVSSSEVGPSMPVGCVGPSEFSLTVGSVCIMRTRRAWKGQVGFR